MSNKAYDIIKFISLIIVPAAVCVAAIITAVTSGGSIQSIVLAIGEALAAFLGAILTIVSKKYFANKEIVDKVEE